MSFQQRVQEITDELADLLVRKNQNYGDSYAQSVERYGPVVTMIRLEDKLNRLRQLLQGNEDAVGESIEDTLKDLAGYAVIELERRQREGK